MSKKYENIAIALAGLTQNISLIRELAQTGKIDEDLFKISINSIFQTNPDHIAAVFGGLPSIQQGLETLIQSLEAQTEANRPTWRYILSLIGLQKKIMRAPKVLHNLTQRIQQAKKQVDYFHPTHPTVINNLADVYLNAIIPFGFKIYILGNQRILSVHENMDKIRVLLLAAVRSAVLWEQMGGSRLQFIFARKKIKTAAKKLLTSHTN